MPNPVYYIHRDGSYGVSTNVPQDAIAISEDQYQLIANNPGLIDISIKDNVVHLAPSLICYKKSAITNMQTELHQQLPDEARLNRLARAVICGQECFDQESGLLLSLVEARGSLEYLNRRNTNLLYVQAKYNAKVNAATEVIEIDAILGEFEQTLQGIV